MIKNLNFENLKINLFFHFSIFFCFFLGEPIYYEIYISESHWARGMLTSWGRGVAQERDLIDDTYYLSYIIYW